MWRRWMITSCVDSLNRFFTRIAADHIRQNLGLNKTFFTSRDNRYGIWRHIFWHIFWHFNLFWHSICHSFWHSIWHLFWRSSEDHSAPELAVRVRRGTLRSSACTWGPAENALILSLLFGSGAENCDLALAVEARRGTLWSWACCSGLAGNAAI